MFTRPPDEDPNQLEAAGKAMEELGKVLDETKPDVVIVLGADHVETFSVTCIPSFCLVAGDRAVAKFAGRTHDLPIHREMAEDVLNKLVTEHNFDIAYSEDAELGHAFSIPFEYVIGKRNIPVIPFFTNVYVPPLPTPRRWMNRPRVPRQRRARPSCARARARAAACCSRSTWNCAVASCWASLACWAPAARRRRACCSAPTRPIAAPSTSTASR